MYESDQFSPTPARHPPATTAEAGIEGDPVLKEPIVIVGAARSGTNLVPEILVLHSHIAYLGEPNYLWKHGHAMDGHDMLASSRATPEVRRRIRRQFASYCAERGGRRLCEKTPANSLRLGFVMQVLPDARVIHIVRDGRNVAASVRKKFYGNPDRISRPKGHARPSAPRLGLNHKAVPRLIRRARQRMSIGLPVRDLVYYLPDFIKTTLTIMGLKKKHLWGPRIPGMRQLFRSHSALEVAALQWRMSVESILNYRASHPEMAYLEIKYEDMCRAPIETAREVYRFCGLDFTADIERRVRERFADAARIAARPPELDPDEERQVEDLVAHTLAALGYERSRRFAAPDALGEVAAA